MTGSRTVGMKTLEAFTRPRPKPTTTEMGGKNPAIVTASADLDKAAIGVMRAAFGYGGQKWPVCARGLLERGREEGVVGRARFETRKIEAGCANRSRRGARACRYRSGRR